jgi:hypothetical protein
MNEDSQLTKLLEWLEEGGRSKAWFARQIHYSYQQTWDKLAGRSPLNDNFVVACFRWIPELPRDVFEEHGYTREDGCVFKRIELEEVAEEAQP